MKRYEYKFIKQEIKLGSVQPQNIEEAEKDGMILEEMSGSFVGKASLEDLYL